MTKLNVNDYLALNSDERYAAAVEATIATMGEETFNEYYHDTKNRWRDLAAVWDGVLEYALHHIYWGVYPHNCEDSDMLYLCSLAEDELLDDGEAYEAWSRWPVFEMQLEDMADQTCSYGTGIETHFIEHHNYQDYREMRRKMLTDYCAIARLDFPNVEQIIGVAHESSENEYSTEDFLCLDAREWAEEEIKHAKKLRDEYKKHNYLGERKYTHYTQNLSIKPVKGRDRNKPCPCGSGKKFKKCCGRLS